jgi:hypothetical protein
MELQQVEQEHRTRLDWDHTHKTTLAEARIAASELRRRELQALLQLAHDPPAYLLGELGRPPTAEPVRTAWLGGARAIVAYRTTHAIDGPEPLGPSPADPLMRIHHRIATRHLDHAKQQLQRAVVERPERSLPPQTVELTDSLDPPL